MKRPFPWSHRSVLYLASALLFGSVLLRSLLIYRDDPVLYPILALLFAWLFLLAGETALSSRWARPFAWHFPLYLFLQTLVTLALLFLPNSNDYFATLVCVLSMQIAQRTTPRIAAGAIAFFSLIGGLSLMRIHGPADAITLGLVFASASGISAYYVLAARRAESTRADNLVLAEQLQVANRKLQIYSAEAERLATARERQRLARELHDSITQTIFSMTLTTQSASLLLRRDSAQVGPQLTRLIELARNALSEMRTLVAGLDAESAPSDELAAQLRRHVTERQLTEDVSIVVQVQGRQSLSQAEEQNLFRIVQEAVNNIVKHAGPCHACIRLCLEGPTTLEIEDDGRGFDPGQAGREGRYGLASMRERAAEIGWTFSISACPGAGTRIRLEKPSEERRA